MLSTVSAIISIAIGGALTLVGAILAFGIGGGFPMAVGVAGLALLLLGYAALGDAS